MKPFSLLVAISILAAFIFVFGSKFGVSLSAFPPLAAIMDAQKADKKVSNVFRTVDGGNVWFAQSAVNAKENIGNMSIYDISLDVIDSNIAYIGTAQNGMFRTINNGQNWEKIYDRNNILSQTASVLKIEQDKKNPDNIYVAAFQNQRGVFLKSTDGGLSFIQTYITELDKYTVNAIAIDPSANHTIYIGTSQGGFFTSVDFGQTWAATEWIPGKIADIVINPHQSSEIYVVTNDRGLFRTQDKGKTWKNFSKEISKAAASNQAIALEIDPSNSNILYLAVTNGMLKSTDRGVTWKYLELLIPPKNLPVDSIKIDQNNRAVIYVGVKDLIYRSNDSGTNWSVIQIPIVAKERRIGVIEVDKRDSNSVYLGIK